ncbi:MAG: hypothetical protein DVB30_04845 [Verrucomicrobia bacterium]|nr:MAG: hypothetical protein DVB30_04845 [Verrucomicrobiota bacterium]
MTKTPRIISLQQSVRESRLGIAREYAGLMDDLDVQKRFQNSFKHYPVRWISGAAVAGIMTALLRGRSGFQGKQPLQSTTSTTGVSRLNPGWLSSGVGLVKLLFPILQPFVMEWIGTKAKSELSKKAKLF